MSSNFKKKCDKKKLQDILRNFLILNCIYEKNYYIINNEIFKKYKLNNQLKDFIENIREYYINSKKYFLDRDISFNILLTIIRQICRYLKIEYIKKIIYNNNNYNIQYSIYLIHEEILLDSIDEETI